MGHDKLAALLALLLASGVGAVQVDFDDVTSGALLDDEFESANHPNLDTGKGFTITTTSATGWATLYDTELTGGEDNDLEGPVATLWTGGNLSGPQTPVGNLVIVQEWVTGAEATAGQLSASSGQSAPEGNGPGGMNAPDDDGAGGTISLQFESPLESLGFIWVDLDDVTGIGYSVDFIDNSTAIPTVVNVAMNDFVNPASSLYDPTVAWGDHNANLIDLITAEELTVLGVPITQFDQVDFNLGSSGGIAFVRYKLIDGPEPGTLPMIALGLAWLARRRRTL